MLQKYNEKFKLNEIDLIIPQFFLFAQIGERKYDYTFRFSYSKNVANFDAFQDTFSLAQTSYL